MVEGKTSPLATMAQGSSPRWTSASVGRPGRPGLPGGGRSLTAIQSQDPLVRETHPRGANAVTSGPMSRGGRVLAAAASRPPRLWSRPSRTVDEAAAADQGQRYGRRSTAGSSSRLFHFLRLQPKPLTEEPRGQPRPDRPGRASGALRIPFLDRFAEDLQHHEADRDAARRVAARTGPSRRPARLARLAEVAVWATRRSSIGEWRFLAHELYGAGPERSLCGRDGFPGHGPRRTPQPSDLLTADNPRRRAWPCTASGSAEVLTDSLSELSLMD